jgi:hypothetical protein
MKNALYFGDNLDILREHIKDESIDLVYLDPPFNSNANYNVLFKSPKGHASHAQIEAFDDTWHWGPEAEKEFNELLHQANTDVSEMMQALRKFLGENDMMAYLTMMANRLLELRRVLKSTGTGPYSTARRATAPLPHATPLSPPAPCSKPTAASPSARTRSGQGPKGHTCSGYCRRLLVTRFGRGLSSVLPAAAVGACNTATAANALTPSSSTSHRLPQ